MGSILNEWKPACKVFRVAKITRITTLMTVNTFEYMLNAFGILRVQIGADRLLLFVHTSTHPLAVAAYTNKSKWSALTGSLQAFNIVLDGNGHRPFCVGKKFLQIFKSFCQENGNFLVTSQHLEVKLSMTRFAFQIGILKFKWWYVSCVGFEIDRWPANVDSRSGTAGPQMLRLACFSQSCLTTSDSLHKI